MAACAMWTTSPRVKKPCLDETIADLIRQIRIQEETTHNLKEVACQAALDHAMDMVDKNSDGLERATDWLCENLLAIQGCDGTAGVTTDGGAVFVVSVNVADHSYGVFNLALFEDYISPLFEQFDLLKIGLQIYKWTARKKCMFTAEERTQIMKDQAIINQSESPLGSAPLLAENPFFRATQNVISRE